MTWIRNNALAMVAIVIALSTGAYAVTTAPKDSVVSKSIKNGAVKAKDLAAGSVDAAKIQDGAVTADELGSAAVTEPKLAPGSVTGPKLAPGSVTGPKLAPGSVTSVAVGDDSLGGTDIDESTLVLPPAGDAVDMYSARLDANTATALVASHNGVDVLVGCDGPNGGIDLRFNQAPGTGVHETPGLSDAVVVEGAATDFLLAGGLQNGYASGSYYYVRDSDGAAFRLDYAYDNDNFNSGSLSDTDCVYSLIMTYTQP